MKLSLLTITNAVHVTPLTWDLVTLARGLGAEMVVAHDVPPSQVMPAGVVYVPVTSKGYMESVLDEAVAACSGDYILRVDDDERCSPALVEWLKDEKYRQSDSWHFPRVNLWKNTSTMILNEPLYPDWQTRLTTKALAGGRGAIHSQAIKPGARAKVCVEHHQFLVKSLDERRVKNARYEAAQPGAGKDFLMYSCPEDYYDALDIGYYEHGKDPLFHRWTSTERLR